MPPARIPARLAAQVAARAGYRCEYCRTPNAITAQAFHVDHIIPVSRGGPALLGNLCFACPHCNLHKGDRIEALDPRTQQRSPLFNPRAQNWDDHFRWSVNFQRLLGRTATGRATVAALDLNTRALMRARMMWAVLGMIP